MFNFRFAHAHWPEMGCEGGEARRTTAQGADSNVPGDRYERKVGGISKRSRTEKDCQERPRPPSIRYHGVLIDDHAGHLGVLDGPG